MNLIDPIIQSYIYTDVYNSLGGSDPQTGTIVGGVPVSKLAGSVLFQLGGAKTHRFADRLSVPAGLVLIEEPAVKSKLSNKLPNHCEVIPDKMFDHMVELASVPSHRRKKQSPSQRPKKGQHKTQRRGKSDSDSGSDSDSDSK